MLKAEYERTLERIIDILPKRIYHPQKPIGFEGFFTYEHLSLSDAQKKEKQAMPEGLKWGEKWQYAWLFAEVTIPENCKGKRVMFTAKPGECLVFVNGKIVGAFDKEHTHITLAYEAVGGEKFEIAMEVYAGHTGGLELNKIYNLMIPEFGVSEFPESGVTQQVISNGSVGIMYDEVYNLWMDIMTLYDLRKYIAEGSLRLELIDDALSKMCLALDIEAPFDDFLVSVEKSREILKPSLACKNGSTTPVGYAIGNSHLDLEWLWTNEETRRKAARTLGNQLKIIEEYPEYRYIQSQPWLFESIKADYPELYEDVKVAIKKGSIIPEGGSWVQTDANIPSGENLIRQFLVGKQFIKKEFDFDSELFWLPDSFGASGALPQILKGCGIKYFFSAKVKWQYNGGDKFPKSTFRWQGIDGSEVLTHISVDYAGRSMPSNVFEKWNMNDNKVEVPAFLFTYGCGDGGGGATRTHLEYLRREQDLEGMPVTKHSSPVDFFKFVENECDIKEKMVGELYYSEHRGTYTTQAETKKLNRKSEFALRDAEFWSSLLKYNSKAETDELWKTVLFNDFHDILPGTSISAVHDKAEKNYLNVIEKSNSITDTAISSVVDKDKGVITVFNSLSWERTTLVELPAGYTSVEDETTQKYEDKYVACIKVPACGIKSFRLGNAPAIDAEKSEELVLENEIIRAEFNNYGELISLIDKKTQMEFLKSPSNVFRLYRDLPSFWDSSDIESHYEDAEIEIGKNGSIVSEYKGDVVSELLIKKRVNNSEIKQRVLLKKDSPYLEFETEVDWKETHKLLKVDFNTNINAEEMISEIQFGHIKRPTHRNRAYDADRFEVSQHKWSALTEAKRGVAILNDCKYGIGGRESAMSLTLLKSAQTPSIGAETGVRSFTYAVMPFVENFADSLVIEKAYELNSPVIVKEGYSEQKSFLSVSEKNIIIDTVKFAEDNSGDIIIRMYESKNTYTSCKLKFGFNLKAAYITDMLEKEMKSLEVHDNEIELVFKPFKVVTVRITSLC